MLAAVLVACLPFGVKAQNVRDFETYEPNCESIAECGDLNVNSQEAEVNGDIAQTRRTRRTRSRTRTNDSKFYVGGNIGPFIPFDSEADIGFGGGILGGYKLTKNISAEIEIYDYFGGVDEDEVGFDDSGFNNFGAVVNGVYRYHINSSSKSPYIFAGLGIGIGVSSITGDAADALEDLDEDTSETGFLFQGKGGVGYPLTDKIDVFGQTKFFSIFIDEDDADGVAIDFGATYNF